MDGKGYIGGLWEWGGEWFKYNIYIYIFKNVKIDKNKYKC